MAAAPLCKELFLLLEFVMFQGLRPSSHLLGLVSLHPASGMMLYSVPCHIPVPTSVLSTTETELEDPHLLKELKCD
jgi:hypothetical protein